MYRFLLRPKWIAFHLLVLAGIVAMINLGFWQLRRLDERQAFNATVEQQMAAPPVALGSLGELDAAAPGDDAVEALEWQHVTVDGTFLADEQLRVVNRSQSGVAGDVIVTPFELADGRVLLVARGFVPIERPATPPPDGEVTITGRLRQSEERGTGELSDPAAGDLDIAHRVDIGRLSGQLPGEVVPMFVELTAVDGDSAPDAAADEEVVPQPLDLPDLGEGPHLSYAVQWFIFSVCVAIGWVLAVRHSIGTRRRDESSEGDGAGEPVGVGDDSAVGPTAR